MTFAKASALGACVVGAMAVGIWIGPYVRGRGSDVTTTAVAPVETVAPAPVAEPSPPAAQTAAARPAPARAVTKRVATSRATVGVIGFAPEVQKRLKPLLNQGADLSVASDGFRNAEQFATTAHASRNTEVPFMVLKHRVLSEGMTLPAAILASKPDLNAVAEVNRARAEAKIDLTTESQVASNQQ